MKKILFTSTLLFLAFIVNAQNAEGKWSLEKMNFFGTLIYFDNSIKDKENFINSYIKILELKDMENKIPEVKANKDYIYAITKHLYGRDIEISDVVNAGLSTNGILHYFSESTLMGQRGRNELVLREAGFRIDYDEKLGYNLMTFADGVAFHQNVKMKISLKENKLVLETIRDERVMPKALIFFYQKK